MGVVKWTRNRVFLGDKDFRRLLMESAGNVRRGAEQLYDLVHHYENVPEKVAAIKATEHAGDNTTHEISHVLRQVYVTRFDHEDIAELAKALDDILDLIEATSISFQHYEIVQPTESAKHLADLLKKCVIEIEDLVSKLDKPASIKRSSLETIHRYENEADDAQRAAASKGFKDAEALLNLNGKSDCVDWQEVAMKLLEHCRAMVSATQWHEIYRRIENAIDRCEDVADIVEGMITKYS